MGKGDMKRDNLGNRMKGYEAESKLFLEKKKPAIIRLDGKAFHTFTRKMAKPFDLYLTRAMVHAAIDVMKEVQGCKLGYVQSDEVSLLLTDYDRDRTSGWFDYNVQKMVSVSASVMTVHFNNLIHDFVESGEMRSFYTPAYFDSRVFSLPREEVCNYFIWRHNDCVRNSVSSVAQSLFSAKQLHKKSKAEMLDMIADKVDGGWQSYMRTHKHGVLICKSVSGDSSGFQKIENFEGFTLARDLVDDFVFVGEKEAA